MGEGETGETDEGKGIGIVYVERNVLWMDVSCILDGENDGRKGVCVGEIGDYVPGVDIALWREKTSCAVKENQRE